MAWFKREKRAGEPPVTDPPVDDVLLRALLGGAGTLTKAEALNIPSVVSCINFIAGAVSMLPVKLYREQDGKAEEVRQDERIRLLNDDPGDTLDAVQFWRAVIADYFLGKGGYAYIRKDKNRVISLHYVDETFISVMPGTDPIVKDYDLFVQGRAYKPYDFIKLLRNTKNGAIGSSILDENPLMLSVAYHSLRFEESLVKKGGNKKGFIKAQKKLDKEAMQALKDAWAGLYSNSSENVLVLNEGLDFRESSNTSVEMQLRENKESNASEICKLFNLGIHAVNGTAAPAEYANAFKSGVMPLLRTIECALNRDLLLEKEKQVFYYAFDTKELLKGDIKARFEAYKLGLDAKFLQIDEVRFMEDLPALGLSWINLGLDAALYDVKTKQIYTPNTNQTVDLKKGSVHENRDTQ